MEVDEFLAHHGVKGMKWGVVNEDAPAGSTPTKQETTTAKRNANAKKYADKADGYQKQIDAINAKTPTTSFQKARAHKEVQELKAAKKQALTDAQLKRDGKLSTKERKVAIGAAVVAGALVTYGAYRTGQSGAMTQKMQMGKEFITGQSAWKKSPGLARADFNEDAIKYFVADKINPGYGLPGTKVNCRRCTFAYEMRRRGYDVAATHTTNGFGQDMGGIYNALNQNGDMIKPGRRSLLTRVVKEGIGSELNPDMETPFTNMLGEFSSGGRVKIDRVSEAMGDNVFNSLRSQPNGARGELAMSWRGGSAHSVAWEIVNGRPVIFDTQSGKMFKTASEFKEYGDNIADAGFTRLDNIPLNEEFLKRWVKSA